MRVMPPPPQHSRIDLVGLKSQITKRIGMEKAQNYFRYLNRFLSMKLSKEEFDKLCIATLGRENVALHNTLMKAILRNAHQGKVPPPGCHHVKNGKRPSLANHNTSSSTSPSLANGDALLPLPRGRRSVPCDRRTNDRLSPLGLNGRMDGSLQDHSVVRENGDAFHCDLRRPVNQAAIAENSLASKWMQRPLQGDVASLQVRDSTDVAAPCGGMELELREDPNSTRAAVQAPLGLPFCPASTGGSWRPQIMASGASNACFSNCAFTGQLCHTHVLKERMDRIAESRGLGGVTVDCANLVNIGLDAYLKRLIRSCTELVGTRSVSWLTRQQVSKQQPQERNINGAWPGSHVETQGAPAFSDGPQHPSRDCSISLLDFRVAMELNAQQLGENWAVLLEKISLSSYEEYTE